MRDSTRRTIRTGIDLILGVAVSLAGVLALPGVTDAIKELGFGRQLATFGLILFIVTGFITKLKNYFEDKGTIPALLKAPANSGVNPVPEQGEK